MDPGAPAAASPPPWTELPAEVLGEIARHLHDAAGSQRFHAVCKPWRGAASSSPAPMALHPWLIAPCGRFSSGMHFHWPFSTTKGKKGTYLPHFPALRSRRFDAAGAATVLAAGVYDDDRTASLVNPLTGDATPLPLLPYRSVAWLPAGWSRAVFCSNGAVMLDTRMGHLMAAVLQPGEKHWREIDVASSAGLGRRDVLRLDEHDRRAAALCSAGVLAGGNRAVAKLPALKPKMADRYVLDYHGELMCVDVLVTLDRAADTLAASVSVHALEAGDDGGPPRWVARERGRGTEHVCLFLGWESSFAVDAREFAAGEVAGGCAYFVARLPRWTKGKDEVHGVCRYSFEDATATVVDELPAMFDSKSMWYMPRPRISQVPSPGTESASRRSEGAGLHASCIWAIHDTLACSKLVDQFIMFAQS